MGGAAARAAGTALLACGISTLGAGGARRRVSLLVKLLSRGGAYAPAAGGGRVGRTRGLTRTPVGRGVIAAGHPETSFFAAADTATLAAAFAVGLEAGFIVQGGAVLPQFEARGRRAAGGLLVPLAAGGAELGARRIRFPDLGAGLSQQSQRTLLCIQLQPNRRLVNFSPQTRAAFTQTRAAFTADLSENVANLFLFFPLSFLCVLSPSLDEINQIPEDSIDLD